MTDIARRLVHNLPGVHFLGYQSEINGILRLSDCLLLPSQFDGTSYPLCLIQSIQEHVPAIAMDIGEVRSMMTDGQSRLAGILLENQRDSRAYFAELAEHMNDLCDPKLRAELSKNAARRARMLNMDRLVETYIDLYRDAEAARR
jgi:glycosyltransferase involved in cell wall biosynthesis